MAGKITPSRRAAARLSFAAALSVTAAVSLAGGAPLSGGTPLAARNVLSCPLSAEDDAAALLVVNDPARGPVWGLLLGGTLFLPPAELSTGGREVVSLDASPDGHWVAVVAASEGHTEFSAFAAAELRAMPLDGPPAVLSPVCRFDAYPANVFFGGWDGDCAVLRIAGEGAAGIETRRVCPGGG